MVAYCSQCSAENRPWCLADLYLGHVYKLVKQRNEWDSSMILIMGNHSWRTQLLWAGSPIWTAEDQAASHGGQFDDEPAYIVKMPQQKQPSRVGTRFSAIRTRALLQGRFQWANPFN
jgi:hypothetical protein